MHVKGVLDAMMLKWLLVYEELLSYEEMITSC